ncbi:MAG TPA: hypothetical protein ENJ57_06550, partial [Rhizobiales bacterium]|nr:hypothetical protein [Hyphomicrobiales bacterium]
MSESEALDRLCHLVGLETSYWDLGGTLHEVPAQTKTALLAAMGHDTGSPARIQAAIHALETERWTSCLEPVYVLPQAGATLCLSLCEQDQSGDLLWEIEYENGGGASGSCCFSRLGELESRRIEGREYSRRLMP